MTPRPPWLRAPSPTPADPSPAGIPAATRSMVLARAGHRCESCGTSILGTPYSLHHRRPKGMGGTRAATVHSLVNLLALCGSGTTGCHGLVHLHPTAARDAGYLVHQGASPARVAVLVHDGRRVLLTAVGTYIEEA